MKYKSGDVLTKAAQYDEKMATIWKELSRSITRSIFSKRMRNSLQNSSQLLEILTQNNKPTGLYRVRSE